MFFVRLVLPAFLVSVTLTASAQSQQGGDYYFNRADAAMMTLLGNVEKFHLPGCSEGMKTRRYEPALADCEFILRYFPNHPTALLAAADICIAWKSPRCIADRYFEQAIEVNSHAATTYVTKGIYLLRANRPAEAVESLKQAVEISPNSINAQYNIGLAYFETKQYQRSNEHAQRAYALGAPVPGLRDRLKKAGYWKELDIQPPESQQPPPKDQSGDGAKK